MSPKYFPIKFATGQLAFPPSNPADLSHPGLAAYVLAIIYATSPYVFIFISFEIRSCQGAEDGLEMEALQHRPPGVGVICTHTPPVPPSILS